MTSIINLDARYVLTHSDNTGLYSVHCEGKLIAQSFSEDEVKFFAKKHYINSMKEFA